MCITKKKMCVCAQSMGARVCECARVCVNACVGTACVRVRACVRACVRVWYKCVFGGVGGDTFCWNVLILRLFMHKKMSPHPHLPV